MTPEGITAPSPWPAEAFAGYRLVGRVRPGRAAIGYLGKQGPGKTPRMPQGLGGWQGCEGCGSAVRVEAVWALGRQGLGCRSVSTPVQAPLMG